MESKEKIYDDQIAPLMDKIIEICKTEGIPMFADFQIADLDYCTTCIYPPDVIGRNVIIKLYNEFSQCKIEEGVNIDKFFLHIVRNYENHSSMLMLMMGKEPKEVQDESN